MSNERKVERPQSTEEWRNRLRLRLSTTTTGTPIHISQVWSTTTSTIRQSLRATVRSDPSLVDPSLPRIVQVFTASPRSMERFEYGRKTDMYRAWHHYSLLSTEYSLTLSIPGGIEKRPLSFVHSSSTTPMRPCRPLDR